MKPDRFAAQKIGVLKRALESCSKKRVEAGQAAAALDRELSRANREIIAQKKTIDDLSAWVTRSSVRIVELGNELREVKRARQLDGERIAEAVENANRVAAELRAALERSRARETALAQMVNEARARADNAPNCQPEEGTITAAQVAESRARRGVCADCGGSGIVGRFGEDLRACGCRLLGCRHSRPGSGALKCCPDCTPDTERCEGGCGLHDGGIPSCTMLTGETERCGKPAAFTWEPETGFSRALEKQCGGIAFCQAHHDTAKAAYADSGEWRPRRVASDKRQLRQPVTEERKP